MTPEEKMKYFDIAASIVGYKFNKQQLDLMVNLYDLVLEKQGETDLRSISRVRADNEERFAEKKTTYQGPIEDAPE